MTTIAPSPPPQELSTRRIAEQMDRSYNVAQSSVQVQDRMILRDTLEHIFSKQNGIQDMLDQPEVNMRRESRRLSRVQDEDLFDKLPDFVTLDIEDPFQCKCVDCEEDKACGGLWKGKRYAGGDAASYSTRQLLAGLADEDIKLKKIHIVVSHCKSDLDWISAFTKGFNIASIHIISKCGAPVIGAPDIATIEVLPNIGRCDHSYAYYITSVLDQKMTEDNTDNAIVFFLKDDISTICTSQVVGIILRQCSKLHLLKMDLHVVLFLNMLTLVQTVSSFLRIMKLTRSLNFQWMSIVVIPKHMQLMEWSLSQSTTTWDLTSILLVLECYLRLSKSATVVSSLHLYLTLIIEIFLFGKRLKRACLVEITYRRDIMQSDFGLISCLHLSNHTRSRPWLTGQMVYI